MNLQHFANTHRLAVGVRVLTDCGRLLSGSAPEIQIIGFYTPPHLQAGCLCQVGASDLVPKQYPRHGHSVGSRSSLRYFPL
jgi:hypothetical protein